jgi:hypothetical protein
MMFWAKIVRAAASGVPVAIWRMKRGMSIDVGHAVMQGASLKAGGDVGEVRGNSVRRQAA